MAPRPPFGEAFQEPKGRIPKIGYIWLTLI
jgi:hypothetical protein